MSNSTVTPISDASEWVEQIRDSLNEALEVAERFRPATAFAARCQELLDSLDQQLGFPETE